MFCKTCGTQVADTATSCPNCGTALAIVRPNPIVIPGAKSKVVAGILGILVGGFGVHRFYLGYTGLGFLQLAVTLITCGAGSLWGFIEGILILVGSINQDAEGRPLTD